MTHEALLSGFRLFRFLVYRAQLVCQLVKNYVLHCAMIATKDCGTSKQARGKTMQNKLEQALYAIQSIQRFRYVSECKAMQLPVDSPLSFHEAVSFSHKYDRKLQAIVSELHTLRTNANSFYDRQAAHEAIMTISEAQS